MSKAPKPPTPVNPFQVGGAQQQSNINSAIASSALNDINQVTPYGTVTYTFGTPAGGDLNLGKPKSGGGGGGGGGGSPMLIPTSFTPAPQGGGAGAPANWSPQDFYAAQHAKVAAQLRGGNSGAAPVPGTGLAALLNGGQ